jgi:hypothetical protein
LCFCNCVIVFFFVFLNLLCLHLFPAVSLAFVSLFSSPPPILSPPFDFSCKNLVLYFVQQIYS